MCATTPQTVPKSVTKDDLDMARRIYLQALHAKELAHFAVIDSLLAPVSDAEFCARNITFETRNQALDSCFTNLLKIQQELLTKE